MQGFKSAILEIFQRGLDGCALLDSTGPQESLTRIRKFFLFRLPMSPYLERLEGKTKEGPFGLTPLFGDRRGFMPPQLKEEGPFF